MNDQTVTQAAEELNKPITSNGLELDANRAKLADLKQQVVVKLALLKMADMATMLMLFIFMVGFYVADPFHLVTFMTEGFNKNPAEMFTYFVLLAFAGIMAYTIAHLKREHYHHTARHNKNVWKVGIILVIFSMTGEIYNSLGSQQHSQMSKAESSAMFKSVANQQIILNSDSGDAAIADASAKLAQCKERMKQGKERHCQGATARLEALQTAKADNARVQAESVANAARQKTKDMLAIIDANTHPFYKALAELGIPQKLAALLLAAFVAYAFERMHLTLPEDLKDLYQQIAALESDGLAIAKAGLYSHVPENHLGITTRGRAFEVPPEKQVIGFGYPPKTAMFKYKSSAETSKISFGFIPDRGTTESLDAENRRKYPQEIVMPTNNRPTPSDYAPMPRKHSLSPCTVHAKHATPDTRVAPCTVHAEQATPTTRVVPCTVHGEGVKEFTDDLFQKLKQMIQAGQVAPTYRPVKDVLKVWNVGTSDKHRQEIAGHALDRMAREGMLKLNPANDGSTIKRAKYILA